MEWASASRWLGRRVLVTGASGFLGAAVWRLLIELGADAHGAFRARLPPPGGTVWPARLPQDTEALFRAARPEVVLHLASPVDLGADPAIFPRLREGILDATDAVARAALAQGARLLHVGTCAEYGLVEAPLREDTPLAPVSAYAALKAAASGWVMALTRATELQATVVRCFRAYGPEDRSGLIGTAARAALAGRPFPMTDGAQVREWNQVDALAAGILAAAAHPEAVGRIFNLGGGERAPVRDVVARIYRLAGADPALIQVGALPRRPGEVAQLWGDHAAGEALWGPLPNPPLEEGLADLIEALALEAAPVSELNLQRQALTVHADARGALIKAWPEAVAGEVYVVEIRPGCSRGHHLHRRGGEWFVPLQGLATLVVEDPATGERAVLRLNGQRVRVEAGQAHALFAEGDAPALVLAVADLRPDQDETLPFPLARP